MKQNIWPLLISLLLFGGCYNQNAEALFEKSVGLWADEKYDESIQNFITLTKTHPNSHLVDDSLFWIASIYNYYLKEPDRAIRYYRIFNKGFNNSEYYKKSLKELAKIYLEMDGEDRNKAVLIFKKLQEENPSREEWEENQYAIAEYYLTTEEFDLARMELKKFLEKSDNPKYTAKIYSMIGYSYYIQNQYLFSEKAYNEAVEKFKDVYSSLSLVDVYQETNDLKKALDELQKVKSLPNLEDHFAQLVNDEIKTLKYRISKLK